MTAGNAKTGRLQSPTGICAQSTSQIDSALIYGT